MNTNKVLTPAQKGFRTILTIVVSLSLIHSIIDNNSVGPTIRNLNNVTEQIGR